MRPKLDTIARLVGAGSLFVSLSAAADTPAERSGAAWDDAHMQSNFTRRFAAPAPPRVVVGETRYDERAPTPASQVAEQTLSVSPHGWTPGAGASIGGSAPRWAPSRDGASSGSSARAERGSSLRSAVQSARRNRADRF